MTNMPKSMPEPEQSEVQRILNHAENPDYWVNVSSKAQSTSLYGNPGHWMAHHGYNIIYSVDYKTEGKQKTGPVPYRHLSVHSKDDNISEEDYSTAIITIASAFGFSKDFGIMPGNAGEYHIVEQLFKV